MVSSESSEIREFVGQIAQREQRVASEGVSVQTFPDTELRSGDVRVYQYVKAILETVEELDDGTCEIEDLDQ